MSDFTPGEAVAVAPNVLRLTAPNPGVMTGPGTNSYLVGTKAVAVIDPVLPMPAMSLRCWRRHRGRSAGFW